MKKHLQAVMGLAALLILVLALAAGTALAGANGFDISWFTVDGGGGQSHGGPYTLSGTAGQHDAGYVLSGGDYTLAGGFWGAGAETLFQRPLYLPLTLTAHDATRANLIFYRHPARDHPGRGQRPGNPGPSGPGDAGR